VNLKTARNELATGIATGAQVTGYPRPPGAVGRFPAVIVRDPSSIRYHTARANRVEVDLPVFVLVARSAAQDGTDDLDELVSTLPGVIDELTGSWSSIVAAELDGGYVDFMQGGQLVAVGAVIQTRLVFKD